MKKNWLCLAFLLLAVALVQAQSEESFLNQKVIVKMNGGRIFYGIVLAEQEDTLVVQTVYGDLNLLREQIKFVYLNDYEGKYIYTNEHNNRYFFVPSAIPLEQGTGYYTSFWLTTNAIHYGITKNISLGAGFELFTLLANEPIWFLEPKVGFKVAEKIHVATGFLYFYDYYGAAAVGFLNSTYGTLEGNVTLGVAYNFSDNFAANVFDEKGTFIISLSGSKRVSNRLSLVTENNFTRGTGRYSDGLYYSGTHGIHVLIRKHVLRLGVIVPDFFESNIPLPFIGYSIKF